MEGLVGIGGELEKGWFGRRYSGQRQWLPRRHFEDILRPLKKSPLAI
jgi:hypothetical protein